MAHIEPLSGNGRRGRRLGNISAWAAMHTYNHGQVTISTAFPGKDRTQHWLCLLGKIHGPVYCPVGR